jgi:hypothetical protein
MGRNDSDWAAVVYHPATEEGYIDPDLKRAIHLRDKRRCQRCRHRGNLSIHHIIPRSEGGSDEPENLITLCFRCHDYIECLPLRTWAAIVNEPDDADKIERREPAPEQTWHAWVYGGYRNPRLDGKASASGDDWLLKALAAMHAEGNNDTDN